MSRRDSDLLWLRDVIDHLRDCQQQLQWTEDMNAVLVLTETMLRDLHCCRRICETMQDRRPSKAAA